MKMVLRTLKGLLVLLFSCLFFFVFFILVLSPIFLADLYSNWWLVSYVPFLFYLGYLIGEDE